MPQPILHIDGAHGEGGGQLVRSAVALAAISGRPLHIRNIRARRAKPGLAAQHLTAVRAVAALCDAAAGRRRSRCRRTHVRAADGARRRLSLRRRHRWQHHAGPAGAAAGAPGRRPAQPRHHPRRHRCARSTADGLPRLRASCPCSRAWAPRRR
ncbi:MAG: hypothetical protein MZW92_05475 [Comamonadaceae bacterium]|nr:hypothetical protein [Comamonadaceae bacterium]